MKRSVLALLLGVALALAPGAALARSHKGGHHHRGHRSSARCTTCQRNEHGRIKRSEDAKRDFMRRSGHPHGRKGYVVDHIVPLACGGADTPSNMQWQTKADSRAKD